LWDPATGEQRALLRGHPKPIRSLAISPDGRLLATGDEGGAVRIWELPGGALRATLQAQPLNAWISVLAFSPDGKTLVSGDGDPKLWELRKLLAQPSKK
jgi:WD40 repeat protein